MNFQELDMPDLLAEVGVRVRAARLMVNLSQEQLAREARVSRSTIKRLEGGTDSVSLSNLLAVLKTLDCIDMFVNALPEPEHSRQRASRTMGY